MDIVAYVAQSHSSHKHASEVACHWNVASEVNRDHTVVSILYVAQSHSSHKHKRFTSEVACHWNVASEVNRDHTVVSIFGSSVKITDKCIQLISSTYVCK